MLTPWQGALLAFALLFTIVAVAPEESPNRASPGSIGCGFVAGLLFYLGTVIA